MKENNQICFIIALAAIPCAVFSQAFSLQCRPLYEEQKIVLDKYIRGNNGDSLKISTLKFYLGNFVFRKNGLTVFSDNTCRLVDLEEENSLSLAFLLPANTAFDSLSFHLGTDSLTNTSGAMGGDLDPTRGMFWTWQSGYINVKLEGFFSRYPARGGAFTFHLGGYVPPFQTVREIRLSRSALANGRLDFDLAPFFQTADQTSKTNIMSPGEEAVKRMDILAKTFVRYEK